MSALVLRPIDHPRAYEPPHSKMSEALPPPGGFPYRVEQQASMFHSERKISSDMMTDVGGHIRYHPGVNDQPMDGVSHHAAWGNHVHGASSERLPQGAKSDFHSGPGYQPGVFEHTGVPMAAQPMITNRHHRYTDDATMHYSEQDLPVCRNPESYHRGVSKAHPNNINMIHSSSVDSPMLDPTKKFYGAGVLHHPGPMRGHGTSSSTLVHRNYSSGSPGPNHDHPDLAADYANHRHAPPAGVYHGSQGVPFHYDAHGVQWHPAPSPRKSHSHSSIFHSTSSNEIAHHPIENGNSFAHGAARHPSNFVGSSKPSDSDQNHHGGQGHPTAMDLNDGHTPGGSRDNLETKVSVGNHVQRARSNSSATSETTSSHNEGHLGGVVNSLNNSQDGSGILNMGTPGSVAQMRNSSRTSKANGSSHGKGKEVQSEAGEPTGDRRGRNNEASRKYRERRRKMEHETLQDNRRLRAENEALKGQVVALREEVAYLKRCMGERAPS